jgi:hypothetical protein
MTDKKLKKQFKQLNKKLRDCDLRIWEHEGRLDALYEDSRSRFRFRFDSHIALRWFTILTLATATAGMVKYLFE